MIATANDSNGLHHTFERAEGDCAPAPSTSAEAASGNDRFRSFLGGDGVYLSSKIPSEPALYRLQSGGLGRAPALIWRRPPRPSGTSTIAAETLEHQSFQCLMSGLRKCVTARADPEVDTGRGATAWEVLLSELGSTLDSELARKEPPDG